MRRNKKSRILAVLLAVSLSGSSAVYAQAEEVNNPDTDIEICGEEHEMKEVQVVEPTCTEAGYVLWKCQSCGYEEKRDLKKALMTLRWFLQKKPQKILREKLFINVKEKSVIIRKPISFL